MKSKIRTSRSPFLLCVALMVAFAFQKIIDNDTYWLLRVGEEIAMNGIPRIDGLTMHEGLEIVQQQWATAYLYCAVYKILGTTGLVLFQIGLNCLLFRLILILCREFGGDSRLSYAVSLFGASMAILFFGVLRPQTVTAILSVTELIVLEKIRKTGRWPLLLALPGLSVVSVNAHAATWPMIFVYMAPYFAEYAIRAVGNKLNLCRDTGRPVRSLIFLLGAAIISFLIGFWNPYGWRGMTYLTRSIGIPEISNFVAEMKAPSMTFVPALFITAILYIIILCLGRKLPVSYFCLAAGTVFLAMTTARGGFEMLLATTPVVAYSVTGDRYVALTDSARRLAERLRNRLLHKTGNEGKESSKSSWSGAIRIAGSILVSIVLIASIGIQVVSVASAGISGYTADAIPEALEWAEANTNIDKDARIYAEYNNGGYLEFRGYRPFIDARAEVFIAANNGGRDIFGEYIAAGKDFDKAGQLVTDYDFDFIFTYKSSMISAWLRSADRGYEKLYETVSDEQESRRIELWHRK